VSTFAYLDCFAGISGDMLLGALIDAGWSIDRFRDVVARLKLGDARVDARRVSKRGIAATQVTIHSSPHQPHRGLKELSTIVLAADIPEPIQQRAISALRLLAEAESEVHNIPVERIHFHEVGAVDTVIDIVGSLAGFDELKVDGVYCSPVPWSRGTVKTEHGILPVPPPAVALLLKGLPVFGVDIEGETVTPTGATLVRTLVEEFGPTPAMKVSTVGYGAGQRDWPDRANVLRLTMGETAEINAGLSVETLTVLGCNIDDMSPQWYAPAMEALYEAGALDVWLTPVQMKKNRPATVVEILCQKAHAASMRALLLKHTTTLGVREYDVTRYSLDRRIETVDTRYGAVRVKVATLPDGSMKVAPEYEDCAARAVEHDLRVIDVWLAAQQNFRDENG
jgi:uncharacterized protein (TIGR00299 family) protein